MSLRSNFAASGLFAAAMAAAAPITTYTQTNLVSDIPGLAAHTDPNLVNPWGISFSATSPFWISDNGQGKATLYNSSGTPQALVVSIPGAGGGTSAPTGQVFNSTSSFNSDLFIFSSEDGAITGWRGALGTNAEILFDSSGAGAVYKGVALGTVSGNAYLYAADFHNGRIDVFPGTGAPALAGTFTDPTLPSGYAPFNVENLGGQLYVTFAEQQTGSNDEAHGAGLGFVSVFDLNGSFVKRLVSQGNLNAPWGLAMAPAGWGMFGGDLLVGNFGDGLINAYDSSGNFQGAVSGVNGPLVNDGLWALAFGNGGNGGNKNSLYLTAGLNDEADGLFAQIDPTGVPEPGSLLLVASGLAAAVLVRRRIS
jgi:uncharacterized protein (TIGR03118 family)